MKKILVTGGAGFVGRHLVRPLLELGHHVICVDCLAPQTGAADPNKNWPLFDPRSFKNFKFIKNDCRNFFNDTRDDDFDYVFHLAAIVGGRLVIENQPLAVADDLSIDASYWQWASRVKPKKTVFFSSSAAYPIKFQTQKNHRLLSEDMIEFKSEIGVPDLSYGWAKLTGEYLARLAYEKHGLKSVVYRPFSGYGEDQDDSYPFPSICKRAIAHKGQNHLQVWGSGDQMRDFIYIDDCVEAVLTTMDKIENADALNLSTGIYTSFKEFAQVTAEILGYAPKVSGMTQTPEGVFARGGDTKKLRQFGYVPKTTFKAGIEKAIKYFLRSTK